jgi:hypothetical protein
MDKKDKFALIAKALEKQIPNKKDYATMTKLADLQSMAQFLSED